MQYQFRGKDKVLCMGISLALAAGIAYLFYKSVFGMILWIPVFLIAKRKWICYQTEQRKKEITKEFKDGMQSVTTALIAGYSMENAWKEAEKELEELYGEDAILVHEFGKINAAVKMNQPLEKLLEEFAKESEVEDIVTFAEVFCFAKRGGGDFIRIIETTTRHIREKVEVMQEIETVMAAKKLEQKMMNLIPLFILFYLDTASPGFLDVLYGNLLGVSVMTGALAAYVGAFYLAERLISIEV